MNIQRIHGKLEKTVGSSKANMILFVLMFGTFLINLAYLMAGVRMGYMEGVMAGASAPMTFMALLWYFEARMREDNAEIAANDAEIARLEAQIEQAKKDLDATIEKILENGKP